MKHGYAELCVTSNFTFLTGASHPEELIMRAAELGLSAIAITDRNSLAGIVRAYSAIKELKRQMSNGIHIRSQHRIDHSSRQEISGPPDILPDNDKLHLPRLIVGCRLVLRDSKIDWIALPQKLPAYQNLCRLLSLGKRRAEKGKCHLDMADIFDWCQNMILIALPQCTDTDPLPDIKRMSQRFKGNVFLGAVPSYDGSDQAYFNECADMAKKAAAPMVAVGDVLMHHASRRQVADLLTCMRERITIDNIGTRALANAERRLKSSANMAQLFRQHPNAIKRTLEIADRCSFCLSELSYQYPDEIADGEKPQARLERLTWKGLNQRCQQQIPDRYRAMATKELNLVAEMNFPAYFLTVYDIVQYARSIGILCQGRGSAANSIICWALGITDISPEQIAMVFERFVSKYRCEPPDIDVDFEHERREEIIQHIYQKYGRHRAGLCATVVHFRSRAAIREVGKAMGLSQDVTASLSGQIWGMSNGGINTERINEIGLDLSDRRLRQTIRLISEIIGFPRHLSQHVGGFVITRGRLDEMCPIENAAMQDRTIIEWDKDDIDALGILKVDVLGLGMLSCIRRAFELMREHKNQDLTIKSVEKEDKATYDMLCRADAIGVFQVESRAQMNFLPRMQPRTFYDLVIEVAIVRPGPIHGGMVQPYIKRRQGLQKVDYPSPELRKVMEKTLGVPLFQEQAMQIAVVGAGFTPEEADHLRRSLASFRRMGTISEFSDKFVNGMLQNGYQLDFAKRCFSQIEGFADYGFPESHAAAFALLAYVSAWLKCHHPEIFACALLNSQPMGFYAPAQIINDARKHGVEILPVCVNSSEWDNILERNRYGKLSLRLGFRQIKGFKEEDACWITAARGNGYPDLESLWLRAGIAPKALVRLAEADAFASQGLTRRHALWQIKAIKTPKALPLFADRIDGEGIYETGISLKSMHLGEEIVEDYISTRLSLRAHPMQLLRPAMTGLTRHAELAATSLKNVSICGLVITRQRPGTASGVIFLTLEDETGFANIIVWPQIYKNFRRIVMGGRLLRVSGYLQREGIIAHLIAQKIEDMSYLLNELGHPMQDSIGITKARADDVPRLAGCVSRGYLPRARHPREQAKRLFPSRDFH